MRVCFLTPMPHLVTLGGANRSIRTSAQQLAAYGDHVAVVGSLLGEGPGRLHPHELRRLKVPVAADGDHLRVHIHLEGVEYLGLNPLLSRLAEVRAAIGTFDPDVLLVAGEDSDGSLTATAIGTHIPTVIFAQTPDLLPLNGGADEAPRRRLMDQAAGLLVTSGYAQRVAIAAGLERVHLAYPPVFEVSGTSSNAGPTGPIMLCNVSTIKGIDTLIGLCVARRDREFIAVPLWATSTSDRQRLAKHRNITIVEPDEQFERILARVGLLIVPSVWNENFPLTLFAALDAGIPAIVSDIGGLREAGLGAARIAPVISPHMAAKHRSAALGQWLRHVDALSSPGEWERVSAASRHAAAEHARQSTVEHFREAVRVAAGLT